MARIKLLGIPGPGRRVGILEGEHVVSQWVIPIIVALIGAATGGPIVGLLAGIFVALIWPRLSEWWHTRRYLQAIERQEKFLEEYDVCAVSPADYERFLLAILGETDPNKALLMDRKTMRLARGLYPTKAKTAADKKAAWDAEEDRRRTLGLPTQEEARKPGVDARYYKPHYQHLKAGIKVPSCLLCDQNTEEMDRRHLRYGVEPNWKRRESWIDGMRGEGMPPAVVLQARSLRSAFRARGLSNRSSRDHTS